MNEHGVYDVVVLGAGTGGYVAAIRCGQLGLRTALIERADLGGVCLNLGCIPSKAMLRSAEVLGLLRSADAFGLRAEGVAFDYAAVVRRRDREVAQLRRGVTNLLAANNVTMVRGEARIRDGMSVEVSTRDATDVVGFKNLIVATGSRPARPSIPGVESPGVIDSDGALALEAPPSRVVVIGGGAVGVEWAEIWRAFGSEVAVLEMLPQLVPTEDADVARELTRAFKNKGIDCRVGVQVREIRSAETGLDVLAAVDGADEVFPADTVLVATGRKPNVEMLGLQDVGVEHDRRGIRTDAHMRTVVPNIFAVGDVTGRSLLAHIASHQGIIAAETIAGSSNHSFDDRIVPAAIFTHPEIASVGLREADAVAQGIAVRIGRFPFAASGRAHASGETAGFAKIVAAEASGEVLGAHIVGSNAGDLIAEASLAMRLHATLDDLAATIHVHPTFSEAMLEAAWVAQGAPIHVPRRGPGVRGRGPVQGSGVRGQGLQDEEHQ